MAEFPSFDLNGTPATVTYGLSNAIREIEVQLLLIHPRLRMVHRVIGDLEMPDVTDHELEDAMSGQWECPYSAEELCKHDKIDFDLGLVVEKLEKSDPRLKPEDARHWSSFLRVNFRRFGDCIYTHNLQKGWYLYSVYPRDIYTAKFFDDNPIPEVVLKEVYELSKTVTELERTRIFLGLVKYYYRFSIKTPAGSTPDASSRSPVGWLPAIEELVEFAITKDPRYLEWKEVINQYFKIQWHLDVGETGKLTLPSGVEVAVDGVSLVQVRT